VPILSTIGRFSDVILESYGVDVVLRFIALRSPIRPSALDHLRRLVAVQVRRVQAQPDHQGRSQSRLLEAGQALSRRHRVHRPQPLDGVIQINRIYNNWRFDDVWVESVERNLPAATTIADARFSDMVEQLSRFHHIGTRSSFADHRE
jgi:hypothetical protein